MDIEKNLIKRAIDLLICNAELNSLRREIDDAVKIQDYDTAAKLRDKQKSLIELMPTLSEIKDLRSKLD